MRSPALLLIMLVIMFATGCASGPLSHEHDRATEDEPLPPDERTDALPPISGGTLLVTRDDGYIVVSDPDGDEIFLVGFVGHPSDVVSIALEPGDEPGRAVEDLAGRIHVVLRGAGEVATMDPANPSEFVRRHVCAEPRGIAHEPDADLLLVACTSGELVSLPAAGGPEVRRDDLGLADLRDVVVDSGTLWVSRFRSAELLRVADGAVVATLHPPTQTWLTPAEPAVAWRTLGNPAGGVVMVLQAQFTGELGTGAGAYYGSIVETNVFTQAADEAVMIPAAPVPVDLAVSSFGATAVVSAGSRTVVIAEPDGSRRTLGPFDSEPVAAAFDSHGLLFVQLRDPATLLLEDEPFAVLSDTPRHDPGHETFHLAASFTDLACASCHPEAGEDGHTWLFQGSRPRRTQPLRGGLLDTAPFHWTGDLATFHDLMDEVFVSRMNAPPPSP